MINQIVINFKVTPKPFLLRFSITCKLKGQKFNQWLRILIPTIIIAMKQNKQSGSKCTTRHLQMSGSLISPEENQCFLRGLLGWLTGWLTEAKNVNVTFFDSWSRLYMLLKRAVSRHPWDAKKVFITSDYCRLRAEWFFHIQATKGVTKC